MLRDGEDDSSFAGDNVDEKMVPSPRRRKKVVTFASLAELSEIQALATCETDSQSSEIGKTSCSEETKQQALQDPSLFLNMPLEDYDVTDGNVSIVERKNFKFLCQKLRCHLKSYACKF